MEELKKSINFAEKEMAEKVNYCNLGYAHGVDGYDNDVDALIESFIKLGFGRNFIVRSSCYYLSGYAIGNSARNGYKGIFDEEGWIRKDREFNAEDYMIYVETKLDNRNKNIGR